MGFCDGKIIDVLREVEDEFRNEYWIIRNARHTNWRAVNRTRVLAGALVVLGVPTWAIKEGRYCLRLRVCERCFESEFRCHQFSERAKRGDFE